MNIAITGTTGQLGRLVVDALKAKMPPERVVALVRTPAKAAGLGVTVREADYDRPETLGKALAGVSGLLLISANEVGNRVAQHRNVIVAARNAGVKRIVYTSLLHADVSPLSLAGEHLGTEADVKASRLAFTILRNGWYTENYTGFIAAALAGGAFIGCAGEGKISSAPRADYAEAAAVVLASDGGGGGGAAHAGKTYELAGDDAYTLNDLAAEISRQTGTTIPYRNLAEADYAVMLKDSGLSDGMARAIAGWDVGASKGALFDDGRQLSKLIGRATTPLAAMVAEALGRGT